MVKVVKGRSNANAPPRVTGHLRGPPGLQSRKREVCM